MNNARLWTIVNPTVGVPIFFIALVVAVLFVHYEVLTRTTYFADYWSGGEGKAPAAQIEAPAAPAVAQAKID